MLNLESVEFKAIDKIDFPEIKNLPFQRGFYNVKKV